MQKKNLTVVFTHIKRRNTMIAQFPVPASLRPEDVRKIRRSLHITHFI